MNNINLYDIGDICNLVDKLTLEDGVICTIKYIEQDDEIPEIYYYYLIANNESLNDKFDPNIGYYYAIVESTNEYLIKISDKTIW